MRRSRTQSSLPAAAAAPWTSLTLLLVCLCMSAVAFDNRQLAFALPTSTTPPRKLSIPTPYLIYVTPPVPTEAEPQEAWFQRVSLAKGGLASRRHTPLTPPSDIPQVKQCAQAGVPIIQIRDKVLPLEVCDKMEKKMRCFSHPPAYCLPYPSSIPPTRPLPPT